MFPSLAELQSGGVKSSAACFFRRFLLGFQAGQIIQKICHPRPRVPQVERDVLAALKHRETLLVNSWFHEAFAHWIAKNMRKPLLVIQGANDPRVLKVESDEMVKAVRDNGVPVEYIVFPDEGHGFRKKENRIQATEVYLKFLDRYLRD